MKKSYRINKLFICFFILFASLTAKSELLTQVDVSKTLLASGIDSINKNIVSLQSGNYLTAGAKQFRSLWTRDFCFSVRALIKMNRLDIVRNQLNKLIEFRQSSNNLVPRTLDSIPAQQRVAAEVANSLLGTGSVSEISEPLSAEYISENNTEPIDSNVLTLIAATDYLLASGDKTWWSKNEKSLIQIFKYYNDKKEGLLIKQPAYSDWQDSVSRVGFTFYTNLLYGVLLSRLVEFPAFNISKTYAAEFKTKLIENFYDPISGLYFSVKGYPQISLDGILLAIDYNYFGTTKSLDLFNSLKKSPLWSKNPGFVTYPNYPTSWVSTTTQIVGLSHYHDEYYWSWLMGLALKTSVRFNDTTQSNKLTQLLQSMAVRDGGIGEIFINDTNYSLWKSSFFSAEVPFSWGASFIVDALL